MSTERRGRFPRLRRCQDPHGIAPSTPEEIAADAVKDLPAMVQFKIAAATIGVSVATLRRWRRRGLFRVGDTAKRKAAGRLLVPRIEIERLIVLLLQ